MLGLCNVITGSHSVAYLARFGAEVIKLDPYAVRPLRGSILALAPAEKYGASTRIIMRELGYEEEEIDALLADGSISESWSREYLPS